MTSFLCNTLDSEIVISFTAIFEGFFLFERRFCKNIAPPIAAHIAGQAAKVRIAGTAAAMAGTVVKAKYDAIPMPAPAEENIAIFLFVILPVSQDKQFIFSQITTVGREI